MKQQMSYIADWPIEFAQKKFLCPHRAMLSLQLCFSIANLNASYVKRFFLPYILDEMIC